MPSCPRVHVFYDNLSFNNMFSARAGCGKCGCWVHDVMFDVMCAAGIVVDFYGHRQMERSFGVVELHEGQHRLVSCEL